MKTVVLPASVHATHPDYTREVYTVDQAACYLCVSKDRVRDEANAGRLAHRRHRPSHGGRLYFSQSDLDAWRRAGRVEVDSSDRAAAGRTAASRFPALASSELPLPSQRRFR